MKSLSQRTQPAAQPERLRELQEVELMLVDGTRVRGVLHRANGTRTIDYLNRQSEGFVAMTNAELVQRGRSELVAFLAINKRHIVRLIESGDNDDS